MHAMPPKRHLHGHFPQDSGRYYLMHGTAAAKTPENKKKRLIPPCETRMSPFCLSVQVFQFGFLHICDPHG